jgi:hypothetical protein
MCPIHLSNRSFTGTSVGKPRSLKKVGRFKTQSKKFDLSRLSLSSSSGWQPRRLLDLKLPLLEFNSHAQMITKIKRNKA